MSAEVWELTSQRQFFLAESIVSFFSETAIALWIEATASAAAMIETEPPPGVGSLEETPSLSCAAVNTQSEVAALFKLLPHLLDLDEQTSILIRVWWSTKGRRLTNEQALPGRASAAGKALSSILVTGKAYKPKGQ